MCECESECEIRQKKTAKEELCDGYVRSCVAVCIHMESVASEVDKRSGQEELNDMNRL